MAFSIKYQAFLYPLFRRAHAVQIALMGHKKSTKS